MGNWGTFRWKDDTGVARSGVVWEKVRGEGWGGSGVSGWKVGALGRIQHEPRVQKTDMAGGAGLVLVTQQ